MSLGARRRRLKPREARSKPECGSGLGKRQTKRCFKTNEWTHDFGNDVRKRATKLPRHSQGSRRES